MTKVKEALEQEKKITSLLSRVEFVDDDFHIWSLVGDKYISTIYRQSSACINNPPWYYETMIWHYDPENKKMLSIAHIIASSNIRTARKRHWQITQSLMEKSDG